MIDIIWENMFNCCSIKKAHYSLQRWRTTPLGTGSCSYGWWGDTGDFIIFFKAVGRQCLFHTLGINRSPGGGLTITWVIAGLSERVVISHLRIIAVTVKIFALRAKVADCGGARKRFFDFDDRWWWAADSYCALNGCRGWFVPCVANTAVCGEIIIRLLILWIITLQR